MSKRERAQYMHSLSPVDLSADSKLLISLYGRIAQLVRALASHARGRRFESYCDHHLQHCKELSCTAFTRGFVSRQGDLVGQNNLFASDSHLFDYLPQKLLPVTDLFGRAVPASLGYRYSSGE
jgi:hypothetical protein